MPDLQALGYNAFLIKGALNDLASTVYAVDPSSMLKASLVYAEAKTSVILDDLLRMIGLEFIGPFIVRVLVCPTGQVFEARRYRHFRITREEMEVIKEVSANFLGIKDASKKLGMSWQSVVGLVRNAKSKGLLLGPIIYWKPSRRLNLLGVIVELERAPPRPLVNAFIGDSSVVIMESIKDFTHLMVGVVTPRKLIEILDEYSNIINKVYLAPDYPLQPLKSASIIIDLIRQDASRKLARVARKLTVWKR